MKKRIAVISGAAGFVGSNLAKRLIHENVDIHALVKKTSRLDRIKDIRKQINLHFTDLGDEKSLKKLLTKISPDFIFHLATFENYRDQTKLTEMIETNIVAAKNLLLASIDIPYTCFINTGSSSEYGLKRKPMCENDLLEPLSYYAVTKAAATLFSQVISKLYNKPIITFRLFSVYGPGETQTRFIPTAVNAAIKNISLPLTNGEIRRDFIYIDDVIDAYVKALSKKLPFGAIYNIGTGKQHTNDEVVKIIEKICRKKIKVEKNKFPRRLWDTDYWVADISKSAAQLEWFPKHSLEEGLEKTYSYFNKI